MNENFEILLKDNDISLNEKQYEQLQIYCDFLQQYNEKVNLTAITETDQIYDKHFFDCLLLAGKYQLNGKIADIGSGAGFPGVIIALYNPEAEVTLLEPIGKKATFLSLLCEKLQLENVRVFSQRAEDFVKDNRESFDFATARAVAALNILDEICLPLLKDGGHFLAMKGPKAYEEIQQAENGLKILNSHVCTVQEFELSDSQKRIIVDIQKDKAIAPKYPRVYGQIKKKPL